MKNNKILLLASLMLGTALLANGTNTLKVKAIEGDTYSLVTDASTLKIGDTIILGNIDAKVALSTTQNKNNRGVVDISLDENKVVSYVSGLQEITLEKGTKDNTWAFNVGDGYLYAASSKSNYLKTEKTLSDDSTWTISISNNNATIKAQGTYTRNIIQYNPATTGKIFSCYGKANQKSVSIFVKNIVQNKHTLTLKTNSEETTDWSFSIEEGTEFDLSDYIPTKENYIFDGWYDDSDVKYTKITIGTSNVVLNAKWLEDTRTKYSISFKVNDGTDTTFETKIVIENESVVLPETNPARDGYKFTGWYTNSEATEKFDETTKITGDLVLYAGWEETNIIVDILKSSDLLATSTTYVESNVKKHLAMYNTNTASTNDTIQIRDSQNSGIVSTISGGLIKKVKISWNPKTADNRILNVYASNEKLSSTSDLYSGNKVKSIGTISNNKKETELSITENYKYIGVNSNSGAIYLDSISFEWEPIKPTVDETILQSSYLFTKMTNGENISNGIRFVGSVKEDKFANLSNVGFNFTLASTDKNVTKDYAVETTKLYNKIDDSNKLVFENKEDETFTLDGYLSYSLILNNISETFTATITFYSYAIIDGVTYNSKTTTINIVNGAKA